jgi:hypothetical protein
MKKVILLSIFVLSGVLLGCSGGGSEADAAPPVPKPSNDAQLTKGLEAPAKPNND